MDFGRVNNLLIWTTPEYKSPIKVNDALLTIDEAKEINRLLELAVKI